MTQLHLDVPDELLERLKLEATREGKPLEVYVSELIVRKARKAEIDWDAHFALLDKHKVAFAPLSDADRYFGKLPDVKVD